MPRNVCFYLFAGSESHLIYSALELEGEREARPGDAQCEGLKFSWAQLASKSRTEASKSKIPRFFVSSHDLAVVKFRI